MKAVVVYESHWGNTAEIAQAIAAGIGPTARALSTAEASPAEVAGADLIVAGSPVVAFGLPSSRMLDSMRSSAAKAPRPPDLSTPSMRSWLETLPAGRGRCAVFETRIRWSPGSATGAIGRGLSRAGYAPLAKPAKFIVTGTYGPLRPGETQRARAWGAELAQAMG
ncbi:MAG: flavodoxin [Chloroflexota bacterium]|nr:MAG: flavodoxin [Chloroflexota bacterium]